MKKISTSFYKLSAILMTTQAFCAGAGGNVTGEQFKNFTSIVDESASTAQHSIGTFAQVFFSLLPLALIIIGVLGGLKFLKKQSNGQEENFGKQMGYGTAGALIGFFFSVVVTVAISYMLTGEGDAIPGRVYVWWKQSLGI
ncbi:hypothetical protein [Campylobacter sp. RM12651]|uniref:hypothetical protein n=1 Tax=Campylobacter sp. RM12651 TaxID=1660079 RepID=UPI001EFBF5DA|nr:hypothetical protein [Campylobacter sp. RM12651]ULO04492.1 putative membrane protein [Campylobacter sp. RM12651]